MTPELFQKIEEIFDAAKRLDAERRAAFLDAACGGERELRQQVEELLLNESRVTFLDEQGSTNGISAIAVEEPERWIGKTISHYEILEKLGEGGMGEVYLVEDTHFCRPLALKILPRDLRNVPDQVHRFTREARACASLRHPNIASIYDYGQSEGTDYVVMEFVGRQTLRQRLKEGPISVQVALEIALQIASALSYVHCDGILHRDLKPDNIMLVSEANEGVTVKLIDFGLGKVIAEPSLPRTSIESAAMHTTQTGTVMGSPGYMSPEQVRGQELDARTDVWSLGVILYEMVAGHRPFDSETSGDEFASILLLQPKPITHLVDLPRGLKDLLSRSLSKDRDVRYGSAYEFEEDLKKITISLMLSGEASANKQAGADQDDR